jgi:hypothetical protein
MNFAHVAVYVVGSSASAAARTLEANGFPAGRLKIGGPEGLAAWLRTVKRTVPTSFHWTMKDREMTTANWVQINSAVAGAVAPTLDVERVDTPLEPNIIKIRSSGVTGIALLLNDDIVDLDREVRVVVNGEPVAAALIPEEKGYREVKLPARLERSSDTAFLATPLKVRKSLLYGMLFPVIVDQIKITSHDAPPVPDAPVPPAGPEATAEQKEAEAKRKFEKAEGYEKDGNLDVAKKLYDQVVGLGATTFKERAEAKLKELETKGSTPK